MEAERFHLPNAYLGIDMAFPTPGGQHDRHQPDRIWEDLGLHAAHFQARDLLVLLEESTRSFGSGASPYPRTGQPNLQGKLADQPGHGHPRVLGIWRGQQD